MFHSKLSVGYGLLNNYNHNTLALLIKSNGILYINVSTCNEQMIEIVQKLALFSVQ